MYRTIQSIYPVQDIFGAYIAEQHCDADRRNLPQQDHCEREWRFEEMLDSLRSALGVRRA
jgi:hypothetical protein